MIGVIAQPEERAAVQEFFELFKTPWELLDPARSYDVVIATDGCPHEVQTRLLVVYNSGPTQWDATAPPHTPELARVCMGEETFPLYCGVATFFEPVDSVASIEGQNRSAGFRLDRGGITVVRLGFDLFAEVAFLLAAGQPPVNAPCPALDQHITVLRRLIVDAGVALLEIPPSPAGHPFIACLTHDIDFLSLRQHRFDRTIAGFLYRAVLGSALDVARGRCGWRRLATNWLAAARLPLVQLGLAEDFWLPFQRYLAADGRPSTFFLLPFKGRDGRAPEGRASSGRATRYDIGDIPQSVRLLHERGCEVGLHGIDAWHDVAAAREELQKVSDATGSKELGVRMHWLYFTAHSFRVLEEAGFKYDATCGYNEAVGYRAGTAQAFKPLGVRTLLALPFQIQDTALFYPDRMNLSESDAWPRCMELLRNSRKYAGVLTISWHDRSLVPERLWGHFYAALLAEVEKAAPWFATASEVVDWFRARRAVHFHQDSSSDRLHVSVQNVPPHFRSTLTLRISHQDSQRRMVHRDLPFDSSAVRGINVMELISPARAPVPGTAAATLN